MAERPDHESKTHAATGGDALTPPVAPPPVERAPERERRPDAPKCPICGRETTPYQGANPHKAGSYECPRCQVRVRPEA